MSNLIDISGATLFGDMTGLDGLTSLNDGSNDFNAFKEVSPGYGGVVLPVPSRISSAQIDGNASSGYDGSGDNYGINIRLYAKESGTPSNSTDGTLLGQKDFVDTNSINTQTIESSDKHTIFNSVWWRVTTEVGAVITEMRVYSAVKTGGTVYISDYGVL
jgi:hypothetical protein